MLVFPFIGAAQKEAPDSRMSFEVASVKPAPGLLIRPGLNHEDSEVFEHRRTTLSVLIQKAYGVRSSQLIGPGWLRENFYEVVAKIPRGATAADVPGMIQRLLEDRFHLVVRRELRSTPIYDLEVSEAGPKLQSCLIDEQQKPKTLAERIAEGNIGLHTFKPGECPTFRLFVDRQVSILVEANNIEDLIRGLERACDRPVLDRTGLKGNFVIAFQATPMIGDVGESAGYPPVPAALKRLGLRLTSRRQDLEYLVVESCDKVPIEN